MGSTLETIGYLAFSLGVVFITFAIYYFFLRLRGELVNELLEFKKGLFQLSKELYFLTQKKELHDAKLKLFIEELKVPQDKQLSTRSLNEHLMLEEIKFKNLLAKEEFFLLCKERILELASDLKIRYNKSIMLAVKLLGLGSPKNKDKKLIGRLLANENPTWEEKIAELIEKGNNLKGYKNLLIHSFISFERELKQKLLGLNMKED